MNYSYSHLWNLKRDTRYVSAKLPKNKKGNKNEGSQTRLIKRKVTKKNFRGKAPTVVLYYNYGR